MKPIKNIEEWKAILKRALELHEKEDAEQVDVNILEEAVEEVQNE